MWSVCACVRTSASSRPTSARSGTIPSSSRRPTAIPQSTRMRLAPISTRYALLPTSAPPPSAVKRRVRVAPGDVGRGGTYSGVRRPEGILESLTLGVRILCSLAIGALRDQEPLVNLALLLIEEGSDCVLAAGHHTERRLERLDPGSCERKLARQMPALKFDALRLLPPLVELGAQTRVGLLGTCRVALRSPAAATARGLPRTRGRRARR